MAYLLVYNDSLGSREDVKRCLDNMDEIITWRYDLPHSFYVISEVDAQSLAKKIREQIGSGRFIISEVGTNKGGWLPPDAWYLLNNKTRKPKV